MSGAGARLPAIDRARCGVVLAVALVLSVALFLGAPQIDLWFSALFFDPARGGFWLAASPAMATLRNIVWDLSLVTMLAALVGLGAGLLAHRPLFGVPTRAWGFVLALYALGPGIIVNLLLKAHWGRARPSDVAEFGGTAAFTPAGVIADQCAANCSFTSGEGSSAAALAIALLLALHYLRPSLPHWAARGWLFLALLLPLAGALQRVATGRHFLSDTVFSVLVVAATALLLHWLFSRSIPPGKG